MNKSEKVLQKDGKVFEVRDLKIDPEFLDLDYEIRLADGNLTPTGHLVIFELIRESGEPPTFVARWDGGSRDPGKLDRYDLDTDMMGMSAHQVADFKKGCAGYSGHHSKRIPVEKGHGFQVRIRTPDGPVFEGTVSFTLHRRLAISTSVSVAANLNISVERAD